MKINAAFAKSLLLVASFGLALPMLAKPPVKPAPAKQEATDKAEGEPADPTIPGVSAKRANGGYVGVTVDAGGFTVAFYDSKKKQVDCDVAQAVIRWNPSYKIGEERRMLNPSADGKTLTSTPVRAPYNFRFRLILLDANAQAVDSFALNLNG